MSSSNIRNFCIIAHIDHGKSTLADRLIECTGVLTEREMEAQVLDNMDIERERGITIKSQAVRMIYKSKDGYEYILNLIDTPGHVDFNYEVSRSLAACEGAVLVVDAVQGVEAQTLANVYLALEYDLELIPVINKIDLPSARPEYVIKEIEKEIGLDCDEIPLISAKNKVNIEQVLESIVYKIPPPTGDIDAPTRALIFDSYYDSYKGVVVYVRIKEGQIKNGDYIKMMYTGKEFIVNELGYFRPGSLLPSEHLLAGDVGYIVAGIKNVRDTRVGDTITLSNNPAEVPLPGYKKVNPMVFCGIYPSDGSEYEELKDALEKLQLNDASLSFEPETSAALGTGFRCGFLGLLHMEIIQERLYREYNFDLVTTAPNVVYKVIKTNKEEVYIDNPIMLPSVSEIEAIQEPIVKMSIVSPNEYIGNIMELCQTRRGIYKNMKYMDTNRVLLEYEMPLNEIIYDFFDALKSKTRGYASLDYDLFVYRTSDLIRLDVLINSEPIDAFAIIVHRDKAVVAGRRIAERLKETIPRHQFEIPIQVAIGTKIIARQNVRAVRKDVLAKCYGGDISRKRKLLEKQKAGKKRMKTVGNVDIPQAAFMSVLKYNED